MSKQQMLKQHIKPHPNPPRGKPCFQVKSKMAAIKPVIYLYFENRYHFRTTKHRRATYHMSFRSIFSRGFYFLTS